MNTVALPGSPSTVRDYNIDTGEYDIRRYNTPAAAPTLPFTASRNRFSQGPFSTGGDSASIHGGVCTFANPVS